MLPRLSSDLDPNVADRRVSRVISRLQPTRGERVVSTRGALKQAILPVARKANEIGPLAV